MEKHKQIEEMAKIICCDYDTEKCTEECCTCYACTVYMDADILYSNGYRKQSKGEWIFEYEFYGKMLCSNCKEEALTNEDNEYVDSDFCPNCGAKMKGGAE